MMMRTVIFLLLSVSSGLSFSIQERRSFLKKFPVGAAALLTTTTSVPNAANAILSSKYCAAGVGEGCDERSEGNEFIKALQEKSAVNREANLKDATLAYQVKNYPDFFASLTPPKYMVMKQDGTFMVLTSDELEPLKRAGKIKMVQATAFGGRSVDFSQKPMMTLVD